MSPKKDTSKTARRTTPQSQESERFTDNELDAMKELLSREPALVNSAGDWGSGN